jgi:PAS domain S-box-containing protein
MKSALSRLSLGAGLSVALLGAINLVSMANPGLLGMAQLTAVTLVLAGSGLAACAWRGTPSRIAKFTSLFLGSGIGLIGAARLAWLVAPWSHSGADPVDHTMSLGSALNAGLLGGAVALAKTSRHILLYQGLILISMAISYLGINHYLFPNEPLFAHLGMALSSALCFIFLAFGLLGIRQDGGLTAHLLADNAGGSQARRLLPFVIFLPHPIGCLRMEAEARGWFGPAGGTALSVLVTVVLFGVIVLVSTRTLSRRDAAFRTSASLLEQAQQVAHVGHVVVTFNDDAERSEQLSWSDETCRLLGYEPGSVAPSREAFLAVLHPDDRARMNQTYAAILNSSGNPPSVECRVTRPDGGHRSLHCIFAVERDATTGRPLRLITTIQDVTERRIAENRLNQQMARLDLLRRTTHAIGERLDLHSVLQVVIASLEDDLPIDFACCCRFDAAKQVLIVSNMGIRSAALARTMALDIDVAIPIDTNGLSRCVAGQVVHEPDVQHIDFPFPRRLAAGGLRGLVAVPLVVDGVVVFVLIVAQRQPHGFTSPDCEYLRQLGEHLALAVHHARLYDDLQRAFDEQNRNQQTMLHLERLRVLGQMATGITHDINNAISPAMLYTEWLLDQETNLSPDARAQLATVKRAIEDVAHTVGRLREFYRQDDGQSETTAVDLNLKVEQVIDMTRARWHDLPREHGVVITVRSELQPSLPLISAVPNEVREALINLVFNAVDAMPAGGTLTLRTRTVRDRVVVEVSDTGTGMTAEVRERCMEPFFTTKGERGTGIGLAMVYGIAQRHHAEIQIASEVGVGTTFGLSFPLPHVKPAVTPPAATIVLPPPLRILIVDDDPRLLASLGDILERDGHRVVRAEGGQAGIDAFTGAHAAGNGFDLVFSDLGMPYVDGRMVSAAVKKLSPTTPVILLTGWGQRLVTGGSAPPQVDRILDKPPTLHALRQALSQLFPPAQS